MIQLRYLDEAAVAADADGCLDFVGAGGEIIIVRDGKPVARMIGVDDKPESATL